MEITMNNDTHRKIRTIDTLQFGQVDFGEEHVFHFSEGLLGFEDLREFVLISEEQTEPFRWLISIEKPEIGFPLLSPWHIDLKYSPGREFDLKNEVLMVVITLENSNGRMTANMKAPIILDVNVQSGRQVILGPDRFSPTYEIPLRDEK